MRVLRFQAGGFAFGTPAAEITNVIEHDPEVVHISEALGLDAGDLDVRTLVIRSDGAPLCLGVNGPLGVLDLDHDLIMRASETLARHLLPPYVAGFARVGSEFLTLLRPSALVERVRSARTPSPPPSKE